MIDYLFHLPPEVAGVVLAFSFISLFRSYKRGNFAEVTATPTQEAAR